MKKGFTVFVLTALAVWLLVIPSVLMADETFPNWPPVYYQGPTDGKFVALTFDDAPMNGCPELLDILELCNVHATFFIEGVFAEQEPDVMASIYTHGHELANHSYNHPDMTTLDDATLINELMSTNDLIRNHTGIVSHLFRPPGGQYDSRVIDATYANKMVTVLWTINTSDYQVSDPSRIVSCVIDNISPGAIILMHDGVASTREALPEIIERLRSDGYTFVTVGEMLEMTHGDCPWPSTVNLPSDTQDIMNFL